MLGEVVEIVDWKCSKQMVGPLSVLMVNEVDGSITFLLKNCLFDWVASSPAHLFAIRKRRKRNL